MSNILDVKNLTKKYQESNFGLNDISFSIPHGTIMGFIGQNGAGKTTTISCILDILSKDTGVIKIFGKELSDTHTKIREDIGVVFDTNNFSKILTANQISKIMKNVYLRWDTSKFTEYLNQFNLPANQKLKTYSKGMSMKLAIAIALSHSPKLLLLDEATSGLDPIVRDELLDVFLDFVQEDNHSILLSSHITSDLEKIADYITFIHEGKIILSAKKDDLIYNYAVIRCGLSQFNELDKEDIIAYRKMDYQIDVLVSDKQSLERKYRNFIIDNISIEDIMLLIIKGETL